MTVCHGPPGAPNRNPTGHRLVGRIRATRAGTALTTPTVVVGRIRRTTTATGLKATGRVMPKAHPTGRKVTAAEFQAIKLARHETGPWWNYTIDPRTDGKNTDEPTTAS